MRVLWLRPSTGEHVSLRRERIASHLSEMGVEVELRDASGIDALGAIKMGLTGEYDAVLGNVRIGLYLGYPLARLRGLPLIGDVSDHISDIEHLPGPLYWLFSRYEWFVLERADACFVTESRTYEEGKRRGMDPIYARNSVDYDTFADPAESTVAEARRLLTEHGVDLDAPIAIYIGSMVPEYSLTEVGAAAELTPEWEFVFLGEERGSNITEIVSGRENAHYLGAFDYDLMPGFVSLASCGLCLVDKEQPLKVMEYGAAGVPTLAEDGKLRRNFDEDELLFIDTAPESIAEALESLSEDPEFANELGERLQQTAREQSWEAIAERYYEQLQQLTDR
jgi:glycosyltransferase involved in cell wall biosynthesis